MLLNDIIKQKKCNALVDEVELKLSSVGNQP